MTFANTTAICRRSRLVLAFVLALIALLLASPAPIAHAEGVVRFYYFYDPHCEVCDEVHHEVLEPLLAEYGSRVEVVELNVAETANFELLLDLERELAFPGGSIPEAVIGEQVLAGAEPIREGLREWVEHYLALGGVDLLAPSSGGALSADCDECDDLHAAARDQAAQRRAAEAAVASVQAVLFWSPTCPYCHVVLDDVLPPLFEVYGDRLQVRTVNLAEGENMQLWYATVQALGGSPDRMYVPMLAIGDQIIIGSQDIALALPELTDAHLAEGGLALPQVPGHSFTNQPVVPAGAVPAGAAPVPAASEESATVLGPPAPIHAAYFYQPGCDDCERAEHDLAYIIQKYPQLQIERFNVREHVEMNQYLCDQAGVPVSRHLTAPAFFVGDGFLMGNDVRAPAIETLIGPYLASGVAPSWDGWEAHAASARQTIVSRFQSFGILAVIGAGLLDGVNPCAFATMIFLISYLSMRKRKGRELLLTGAAFTFGVFITYLGVGFGFLRFLASLPFLHVVGKWIYGATALLCLGLAYGSIVDYRRAREGRLEDMSLKLPERLRNLSKRLIREGTSSRHFVLSALALGFGVSIVELACTGQVYLPTIIFVLGMPEWRARAGLALLIYNLMFILPLVIVFLLVYFGTTSQQLVDWMTRRAATVKLGMAGLFLVLAGWLTYSIVVI